MIIDRRFSGAPLAVALICYGSSPFVLTFGLLSFRHFLTLEIISAFVFVSWIAFGKAKLTLLDAGWSRYLGRVSFSLYTFHYPIIHYIGEWTAGPFQSSLVRQIVTLGIGLPLSLALAHVSASLIERPMIQLGRKISQRMENWRDVSASRS
jgi:peptidoglycan/LPS O-acetylase OafA/YrhL